MSFVRVTDRKDIPEGGVLVTEEKVRGFYDLVVQGWKPRSEVWAIAHGGHILGLAGALSGWYGNMYFRKKLRLRSFGFVTTYLPNCILPFLIVNTFHTTVVQRSIFTDPLGCPICKETRAALVQLGFGLLQPLVLVPFSTFMFATRHFTQRIPSPIHNRPDFYRYCKQLYRPLKRPMAINVLFQIAMAFGVTHLEIKQFLHIHEELTNPKPKTELIQSEEQNKS